MKWKKLTITALLTLGLVFPVLAAQSPSVAQPRAILKHPELIQKLIACESSGNSVKIIDTNGYYSYGILQYQSSTWNWWSKESGIIGDPMVPADAIRMADWAISNGYGFHWSCWRILELHTSVIPAEGQLTKSG